ncbi:MAG: ABC transporter permease [Candidatus Aminicenantes bacterium]|nr:ABC transporter permease [Candidatus Aminicenantes bacterium]
MRLLAYFGKTVREQVRDLASLSMVLVLCPFFVFLYWLIAGGGSTSYKVLVLNRDGGVVLAGGEPVKEGDRVVEALRGLKYPSGDPMLRVRPVADRAAADADLRNRYAAALLILPEDFSRMLHAPPAERSRFAPVVLSGDAGNVAYAVASVFVFTALDAAVRAAGGAEPPFPWREEFVSGAAPRTEFEAYVPGLLILSILLLLFTTALPLIREREERTLRRLRVSRLTVFDLLGGVSLAQIVIGAASIALTFAVAALLGFRSGGSFLAAGLVALMCVGSVVAVGLLTACFCKNATAVLTIGTLPFFLLMWFSGAAMPLNRLTLFVVGARPIALNDFLPPTHAVIALNKILSFGASLGDVAYELAMLAGLTVVYFAAAVWIYRRTQWRKE